MDRVSALNYATVGGKRMFQNENLGAGVNGTEFEQGWHNGVQEEIIGLIEGSGQAASSGSNLQALAAVKRLAGANVSAVLTGSTTLAPDNAGQIIVNATAGSIVLTMPIGSASGGNPMQFEIVRIDGVPAHTVTIALQSGDGLVVPGPLSIAAGQYVRVVSLGGSAWVTSIENAPASLGTGGYEFTTSGTLRQWSTGPTVTGNGDVITFPIPFPNYVDNVVITEENASDWGSPPQPVVFGWSRKSNADFYLYGCRIATSSVVYQAGLGFNYLATGR
jgi:hypothetical protein